MFRHCADICVSAQCIRIAARRRTYICIGTQSTVYYINISIEWNTPINKTPT